MAIMVRIEWSPRIAEQWITRGENGRHKMKLTS
jgi:hypothetical protein